MEIRLKRAYEKASRDDGFRILVDRLWPRGVSKEKLKVRAWAKELAPTTELRRWFAHDPKKWTEFRKRYRSELTESKASRRVRDLVAEAAPSSAITLVYAAKDEEHNEAVVLRGLFKRAATG